MEDQYKCNICDAELNQLMNYCFNCGEKQSQHTSSDLHCKKCIQPVSKHFNHCYACGADLNPLGNNPKKIKLDGYSLKHKCDCGGKLQEFMSYCPWCGEEQLWINHYGKEYCKNCERNLFTNWYFCVFCGTLIDRNNPDSWAREKKYLRPYQALLQMPEPFRENIRKSLKFEWADKSKSSPEWQARELLDCDLKGIIARFNDVSQQIVPFSRNITWREILEKMLSELRINYPAHLSEKELELLLIQNSLNKDLDSLKRDIQEISKMVGDTNEISAASVLLMQSLDSTMKVLFGDRNKSGYSAVISICIWLNRLLLPESNKSG